MRNLIDRLWSEWKLRRRVCEGLLALEFADFMPAYRELFQAVSDRGEGGHSRR
jgi:hypothetical protein